jgi:uncharacterized protein (DUF362 family)
MNVTGPVRFAKRLSRRAFLRLALLSGIAAGGGLVYHQTAGVGFANWFRWMLRGKEAEFSTAARVALAACSSYDDDVLGAIRRAWNDAAAPRLDGAAVLLKPNLVDYLDGHPTFTHPVVVESLIRFLREEEHVKSIVVGEGTTFRRDSAGVLADSGFEEMLRRQGVPFVDLNYDDLVEIPLRGGYAKLDRLFLARSVTKADALISVPKLKTHHWTQVSGSVKNLFGIVPGIKYGWPKNTLHIRGIPEFLAELIDSLPTPQRAAVVDGIVGMQGDGPLFGSPVNVGALVVGTDFLAVDATCARLMGFDPVKVDFLNFAAWAGLGQIDAARIQVKGASLDSLRRPFQPPA